MAYDTEDAARLISWANKQAGIKPLTEAELIQWIDDGVGLLEWADTWEEDGEIQRYIDFPTLISLRLICLLQSFGVSLDDIGEAAPRLRQELGVDWPLASKSLWDQFSVIETVYRLVLESDSPTYLRVRLESGNGCGPFLERLQGALLDRPPLWQRVPLN